FRRESSRVAPVRFLRIAPPGLSGPSVDRDSPAGNDPSRFHRQQLKSSQPRDGSTGTFLGVRRSMDIRRIAIASIALLLSGWSLFEAGRSTRTLQRTEVRHRSAADELRRMQAEPQDALVLWIPGGFYDCAGLPPPELVPHRTPPNKGSQAP